MAPAGRPRSDQRVSQEAVDKGRVSPDHIKFLTYTTRYNKDYWVTVEGMTRLYERADIDAHGEATQGKLRDHDALTSPASRFGRRVTPPK
jgi:hypothetical protein